MILVVPLGSYRTDRWKFAKFAIVFAGGLLPFLYPERELSCRCV